MIAIDSTRPDTAILFFSHRPEREWQNKWFVQGDYAKNRRVAEEFYRRARSAVDESGYPVREIGGSEQRGEDFGARLANALADVFAEGYDRIIAVGGDCPRLGEVDWSHVADRLADGQPVLGPTPGEEGAYLIGLSRSQFEQESFSSLPWKSRSLFGALREHLREESGQQPHLLDVRDDINGHDELLRLLEANPRGLRSFVVGLEAIVGARFQSGEVHASRSRARPRAPRTRSPPDLTSAA